MFNCRPYGYSELNLIEGTYSPSEIHNTDNYAYWYWVRSLFLRVSSVLEFDLPNNWTSEAKDFFYYCLFKYGFVVIFNDDDKGISFQPCTLYGYDFYYQPTRATVTNPALNTSLELTLHEEGELIKLSPDYLGVWDAIDFYAEKLANMCCSFDMTCENSKVAFVFAGKTKSARETIKKILDKISKGVTTVVADSTVASPNGKDAEPFTWLTRNAKDSYIGTDLLQDIQTVLNMFDREIGIPTIPYQKKERMVDFESKSALLDATSKITTWKRTLKSSIENVNKLFGTSISVKIRADEVTDSLPDNSEGGENIE